MSEEIVKTEPKESVEFSGDIGSGNEEEPLLPTEQKELEEFESKTQQEQEDWIKEFTHENGKLFGRFETVKDALKFYRELEIKHTNKMREIKNDERQKEQELNEIKNEIETKEKQEKVISELIPSFIENGMELTDDMVQQLEEVGLDRKDVELGAYKVKERINQVYEKFGGKDNYEEFRSWVASDEVSDKDKSEFNKAIELLNTPNAIVGELAMEGLYNRYLAKKANETNPVIQHRLSGEVRGGADIKPYTSQEELFKDRRAAQSDPALREKYLARLAITPEKVLSLR